jgi:hypothetical protein
MSDPTALINANKGGIQPLITTAVSLYEYQGYTASNIFVVDNTAAVDQISNVSTFNQTTRFRLRKRGGQMSQTWLKVAIQNSTPDVGSDAAWIDDLGAGLIEQLDVEYSTKKIQSYKGEALKFYQRLMDHDITKEMYNGLQLAGLPGVAGEVIRKAYLKNGVTAGVTSVDANGQFFIWICLDWLWFTKDLRVMLTPEAVSSEIEIIIKFRNLNNLVYCRNAGGATVDPWAGSGVYPSIISTQIVHQLVFTPKVEASKHLSRFETTKGLLYKILDFEEQLSEPVSNTGAHVEKVKLTNFRLDSQFLFFCVRDTRINTPWSIDRMTSDTTATAFTGGGAVNGVLDCVNQFRLSANGSELVGWQSETENRFLMRKLYFPGGQAAGAIYFIPFAQKLREFMHCHGYQNFSNLGTVTLEIDMKTLASNVGAAGRQVDVWNVVHNAIQMAQGDIIRIQR